MSRYPHYGWEVPPAPRLLRVEGSEPDVAEVERLARREVWRFLPSPHPAGGDRPALSPEWFLYLASKRYRRHGRWVPTLLEFDRHAEETILAFGDGLGIDWIQFARAGAQVTIVDPSEERLELYRRLFQTCSMKARFVRSGWDQFPEADARYDVVCAFFHDPPPASWPRTIAEAFRVLRPGGKVIMVLPAKYSAAHWERLLMPWRRFLFDVEVPPPGRLTGAELRQAFAAFDDLRIHKRHLRRSDLPYLWRWMILPLAERIIGRYLIVKAFRPLRIESRHERQAA